MASLPTERESDAAIAAFYRDHAAVVVVQQAVGALALVPFVLFGLSLGSGRLLKLAVGLLVAVELVTNAVPLLILALPGSARSLTRIEDIADNQLFVAITIFVLVATLDHPVRIKTAAYLVAFACVLRAWGLPGFNVVAPLAFLAFVLLLSLRQLLASRRQAVANPAP